MNHLIIGYGEVGKALHKIFPEADAMDIVPVTLLPGKIDVMHICFPWSTSFFLDVSGYKDRYKPNMVIIHSSVPIGTSGSLDAVYSPIRGVHPNLEAGIRTFVKFFGGIKAYEAAKLFDEKGVKTAVIRDSRSLEAAKLWDTTQYGVMILLEKEIYKFCRENGVDFELVYGDFGVTYANGYRALGMDHVIRPVLMHKPGPIGGHCVIENALLLDSESARRILVENDKIIADQKNNQV